MIKPEQVPTYVSQKLQRMLYDGETNEAVLIAAALNAWPGAFPWTFTGPLEGHGYVLPLTEQENSDDQ